MNSGLKTLLIALLVGALVGGTVYYFMLQREQEEVKEEVEKEEITEENEEVMDEVEEENEEKEAVDEEVSEEVALPVGSFEKDAEGNYVGTVYLKGYTTIEVRPEAFCDATVEDCVNYEYMVFNYEESNNDAFNEMVEEMQGNSYVGAQSVGLGCLNYDGTINYFNYSDEDVDGGREFILEGDIVTSIVEAVPKRPIVLKLERKLLSGGMGAPTCYSHFRNFEIVELQ